MERQSSPALDFDPNYDVVDSTKKKPTSQSVPNLGTMGTYSLIPDNNDTSPAGNALCACVCLYVRVWVVALTYRRCLPFPVAW